MQYIGAFTIFVLSLGFSVAAPTDEELVAAITLYESIIFSRVADRVSSDIENAKLTDQQAKDWIESIANRLAVCDLEALTFLGNNVREESIYALANGAGRDVISNLVAEKLEENPDFKATVLEYAGARQRCITMVNQEFGIDYY